MKNKLMAAAAVLALMSASNVALANDATDVKALKAQAAALKKQNAALEKRLSKIEKRQVAASQAAPAPASTDFMGMVTKGPLEAITDEGPICWKGVCVFGTFDVGAGWASHGAPVNSDLYFGNVAVNKANGNAYFGVVPSGLSQTTIGIKGQEEVLPGLSVVFKASTGINPQSGQLANAPGSQAANNGLSWPSQSLNADGTRGGQAFNDELYAGVASKEFGTLTFGRQKSLSNETFAAYDPAGFSYNYSLIGLSGTPVAGGGITDDGRLDDAIKYRVQFNGLHFGALYKFIDGSAGTGAKDNNYAYQFNLGGEYQGFGVDVVAGHFNQSITYGVLSAAQVATVGIPTNSLTGVAYDTNDVMIGAKYTWNQFKFFAGWAHDVLNNAKDPIGTGANTGQGDYIVGALGSALPAGKTKVLDTEWVGVKYAYNPKLDITLSYYHEGQNNFASAANASTCSAAYQNARNGNCAGAEDFVSLYGDYHFTKRFDAYAGLTYSAVRGGMANGYSHNNETDWAPTAGVRYAF